METITLFQMDKVPHMAIVRKINDIVNDVTGHERAMYYLAKEIAVGLVKEVDAHAVRLDVRIDKSDTEIGFYYACSVHIYNIVENEIDVDNGVFCEFVYSNVKAGYIGTLEPMPVRYDGDNVGWVSSISGKIQSGDSRSLTDRI